MTLEIKGQIKVIGQPEQKSEKFTKQEIVVTIDSDTNYPQHVPIQLNQKLLSVIGQFQVGQQIKATCNIRGNEWQTKYFLSIEAWKLESEGNAPAQVQQAEYKGGASVDGGDSSLPF
jgi:hypothetical protein